MCIDAMVTEGKKQQDARKNWWRKRRSVYAGVVKAAFRKYVGRSPRKPVCRPRSPVWAKLKRANTFPSGAMAPGNTTQYLMELVYTELNVPAPPLRNEARSPCQREHTYCYTSVYTDEETMDFQHRDFESVFFQNEL